MDGLQYGLVQQSIVKTEVDYTLHGITDLPLIDSPSGVHIPQIVRSGHVWHIEAHFLLQHHHHDLLIIGPILPYLFDEGALAILSEFRLQESSSLLSVQAFEHSVETYLDACCRNTLHLTYPYSIHWLIDSLCECL